jgi:hypothetical protein
MATPTDKTNHTSTKRVSWMAWRKRCMRLIMSYRTDKRWFIDLRQ